MKALKVLVKDFGTDGLSVHGITDNDAIAQAWESATPECRSIDVTTEASISETPLPLSERV